MFAATPQNAVTAVRNHFGRRAVAAAYASKVPRTAPRAAESSDNRTELQKASRSLLSASLIGLNESPPDEVFNALSATPRTGRSRKTNRKAKNGRRPSQAQLLRRPARARVGTALGAPCPPGNVVSTTSADPITECWAKRLSPCSGLEDHLVPVVRQNLVGFGDLVLRQELHLLDELGRRQVLHVRGGDLV